MKYIRAVLIAFPHVTTEIFFPVLVANSELCWRLLAKHLGLFIPTYLASFFFYQCKSSQACP